MTRIDIRALEPKDVRQAASLHRRIFPDYFLTQMGQTFLERFYEQFVVGSGNYGFVALDGDKPVGIVLGTPDSDRLFNNFYRRNFGLLAFLVMTKFFQSSEIRQMVYERKAHISRAFNALLHRKTAPTQAAPAQPKATPFRLLNLGVDGNYRGLGVAQGLTNHFFEALRQASIDKVGLSVLTSNDRAIAFYQKDGWEEESRSDSSIMLWHSI